MGILVICLIFNIVKAVLVLISVVIIYTLLMQSIETKNFEIAVIRMLGLDKTGVILLIICQSFLYVIPAIIAGFGV